MGRHQIIKPKKSKPGSRGSICQLCHAVARIVSHSRPRQCSDCYVGIT